MKHSFTLHGLAVVLTVILIAGCATTKRDWETAQSTDSFSAYEYFLKKHAKSEFAEQARSHLEQLYAQRDWKDVQLSDNIQTYEEFLKLHPRSQFVEQARSRLEQLYSKRDWGKTQSSNSILAYEEFLKKHTESEFGDQARSRLEQLYAQRDWKQIQSCDSIPAYEEFLIQHPSSEFAIEARSRLETLKKDLPLWERVQRDGSIQAYKRFITKNPRSPYVEKAKAIISEFESDLAGRDIVDALQLRKIDVNTAGSGIETVTLRIKRLVNHQVKVVIPVGTFFVCHGSAQNMVGREQETIVLNDNDWQTISLDAACANRSKDIPGTDDSFDIRLSPHQDELKRLMPILREARVSFGIEQAAVWIVTDDADYDDLGTLVESYGFMPFGGTRVIREYEAAEAMKICDKAGIDIMRKAVWRDRGRILEGLTDQNLKRWIQQKSGN